MSFNYNEYFLHLVLIPSIMIVISFTLLISSILISVSRMRKMKYHSKHLSPGNKRGLLSGMRKLVLLTILNSISSLVLLYLGVSGSNFHMLHDNENHVHTLSGVIEDINVKGPNPKYLFENDNVHGRTIVIDNNRFHVMTVGDFQIGDRVIITFLPNSKVVMTIHTSND